jgi:hypothetical protein
VRKLIVVFVTALFVLPALAVAGPSPNASDRAAAEKQCAAERDAMTATAFKLLYETNADKSNAFGKCVSRRASQNAQNRATASAQCSAEQNADTTAFAAKYGQGPLHKNAFVRCVAMKAKAAATAQVTATIKAAKACWTERKANPTAFKANYGTNATKSNAFGKCVSAKVKHSSS